MENEFPLLKKLKYKPYSDVEKNLLFGPLYSAA